MAWWVNDLVDLIVHIMLWLETPAAEIIGLSQACDSA
jgi:hypothetical protein